MRESGIRAVFQAGLQAFRRGAANQRLYRRQDLAAAFRVYRSTCREILVTQTINRSLRTGAVILAAGEGSRMGGMPKCLISVDGQTLISRLINAMRGMGMEIGRAHV